MFVAVDKKSSVAALTTKGWIYIGTDGDGSVYIVQNGHGGLVRSDLIKPESVMWITASAPADTAIKLKKVTVALDSAVNGGDPIAGQDYILRINFRQYYGMSDEDIYQKYGAVHATAAMAADKKLLYAEMIYQLIKNFKRTYSAPLEIQVNSTTVATATKSGATVTLKDASGNTIATSNLASGFDIVEKSQASEWVRGVKQYTPVYFDVIPTTVTYNGDEVVWGTATPGEASGTIPNGYMLSDLEYFCMGERGDQYRNIGWPKSIPTEYFITNPAEGYYVVDVHYAFQGSCEDIQKSEKTLTLVSTTKANVAALVTALTTAGVPATKVKATAAYTG